MGVGDRPSPWLLLDHHPREVKGVEGVFDLAAQAEQWAFVQLFGEQQTGVGMEAK